MSVSQGSGLRVRASVAACSIAADWFMRDCTSTAVARRKWPPAAKLKLTICSRKRPVLARVLARRRTAMSTMAVSNENEVRGVAITDSEVRMQNRQVLHRQGIAIEQDIGVA